MAVPEFKAFLLPTLPWYGDGREHKLGELVAPLGDHFGLSEQGRPELLDINGVASTEAKLLCD